MKAADLTPWSSRTDGSVPDLGRVDGPAKVRGAAVYAHDVRRPGQLWAAVLRSPHPAARIRSIDTSAALAVPGVVDVLTGADTDVTWFEEDVPLLATDTVRFVGDEVAVVAATSLAAARDGIEAIEVVYEPSSFVTELEAAVAEGAPRVHDEGNVIADEVETRGAVDEAFAAAAVVVEATYRTPTQIHQALEAHGSVAEWRDGELTVWCSTQGINDVREMLADRLGLDQHRVRVIAESVGGGFGAKQVPWKPTAFAALLSRRTGRPVHCLLDRRGETLAAGKRNATRQHVRLAADTEGRLLAIDADLLADNGAYRTAGEASNVAGLYHKLYRCENVRTRSRQAYTNTGPAVAFRAPGYVEATFALESAMDELARELGIDPLELRRRNLAETDQLAGRPWSSPTALATSLDRVSSEAHWSRPMASADRPGVVRGRGLAAHEWMAASAQPPGHVWGELNADGTVHFSAAVQDIGTGTRTALIAVAAAELGVEPSRIRLSIGDTAAGPAGPTSAGSTTTPTMAPAMRAAAAELRNRILELAADRLDAPVDVLDFDGRTIRRPGGDDLDLVDLLADLPSGSVHVRGHLLSTPDDVSPSSHGSAVAEVEVDTWTGEIRVTRLVIAPDCGRILDRAMVDSQVIGGATQGIGFALTERQVVDHGLGLVLDDDLEEYLVPTIADSCEVVHAVVDLPDTRANPTGAKGIGELPLIPVPAAIANAIADATGHRFRELPITRAAVLRALADTEERA